MQNVAGRVEMQKAQREKTKIANTREISPNTKTKKRLYRRQQLQMTERSRNRNSGDGFVEECWRCEESGRKKRWEGIHGEVEDALQPPPRPAEVNTNHHCGTRRKWLRTRIKKDRQRLWEFLQAYTLYDRYSCRVTWHPWPQPMQLL